MAKHDMNKAVHIFLQPNEMCTTSHKAHDNIKIERQHILKSRQPCQTQKMFAAIRLIKNTGKGRGL